MAAGYSAEGGAALHALAKALGCRVTSYRRDPSENQAVGGAPQSAHLIGAAVDLGRETPVWKVGVMKAFSVGPTDGWHDKGTAPHYHFTGGPETLLRMAAAAVAVAAAIAAARG